MPADTERLPPLKPVVFHVLLSLIDRERHGYGLVRDIAERTKGRMRLEPANLYRSLRTMLDAGLIEEAERRAVAGQPDEDDERRRYYRITKYGMRAAQAEAARLQDLVAEARLRHLIKNPRRA
jgi:DNA-binding PadR family transcriptional regulator